MVVCCFTPPWSAYSTPALSFIATKPYPDMLWLHMLFNKALSYINSLGCLGIRFGLSNVNKVLGLLDNPEKNFRSVHIAGTNGKGSVAVMTGSILEEAGFKTGLYTSPHLIDLSERIKVNGRRISKRDVARLTGTVRNASGRLSLELTYFEFLTVVAFLYFALKEVDIVVLETGMGGRLDATNVIKNPLVSVITNIDYEHMDYLGNSLKSIAREKAGIIKKNGTVITATKDKEALEVIKDVCRKKDGKLFCAGRDLDTSISSVNNRFQEFDYQGISNNYKGLKIRLRGEHQVQNAALAVGAVEVLGLRNINVSETHIRKGLAGASWPGRLDFIKLNAGGKRIRVILDGAHNPSGIESLKEFLSGGSITYDDLILVFGALSDKDVQLMTSGIVPLADRVIAVSPQVKRALSRTTLKKEILKYKNTSDVFTARTVGEGVRKAVEMAFSNSLICVSGSLYVVGKAIEILECYETNRL